MSGGFNDYADGDKVYIIKSDGSIVSPSSVSGGGFFRYGGNSIEAGDTIVVPVKPNYTDNLSLWTNITQVIYQSLVSLAALDRITE